MKFIFIYIQLIGLRLSTKKDLPKSLCFVWSKLLLFCPSRIPCTYNATVPNSFFITLELYQTSCHIEVTGILNSQSHVPVLPK